MSLPKFYAAVLRYSAVPNTDADLQHLLKKLHYSEDDRRGGKDADHTFRAVLADKLQDHGRDEEAALLRDGHPVKVDGMDIDLNGPGIRYKGGVVKPDYPAFAWPGGIPILYHHRRGSVTLCPDCMNRMAESRAEDLAEGETPTEDHPKNFLPELHEEGPPFECEGCGNEIEAAYGDPDNPAD